MQSRSARERLSEFAYTTLEPGHPLGLLQEAVALAEACAPLEKRLRQAYKEGLIKSEYLGLQIDEAASAEVINKHEADELREYYQKVYALLDVDDFSPDQLGRRSEPAPARKAAKRKTAPRTRTAPAKATKKKAKKKASKKKAAE